MAFFDDMMANAKKLGKDAEKTLKIKRDELRIRNYFDEADLLFLEIGKIVYKNRARMEIPDDLEIDAIIEDIAHIGSRIKNLERNIAQIKSDPPSPDHSITCAGKEEYKTLARKESDLIIKRTTTGIDLTRQCPKCGRDNAAYDKKCDGCGYEFRKVYPKYAENENLD